VVLKSARIESIEPVGDDGFFRATIGIGNHLSCVEVIGNNLTQCVERAYIIIQTFNNPKN
jgi:hypothetical protein